MNTPIYAECVALLGDPEQVCTYLRKRYALFRAHKMIATMHTKLYSIMGFNGEQMNRAIAEAVHEGFTGWPGSTHG